MKRAVRILVWALVLALSAACTAYAQSGSAAMPDSLVVIEAEAFLNCKDFDSVAIPEGMDRILSRAFAGCTLRRVQLASSLSYIANDAFDDAGAPVIIAEEGSYALAWAQEHGFATISAKSNGVYLYRLQDGGCTIVGCVSDDPSSGAIPASIEDCPVTEIGDGAFEDCAFLTDVAIPESVVRLGEGAFRGCASLKSLALPASIETCGAGCFEGCAALDTVLENVVIDGEAQTQTTAALQAFLAEDAEPAAISGGNPKIAAAAEDGLITVAGRGRTTITVTRANGQTISWTVRVVGENGRLPLEGRIIGIDPGHQLKGDLSYEPVAPGSSSTKYKVSYGCTGASTGISEYVTVLEIGLLLRTTLQEQGATVYMTRETHDVNISNVERALLMNSYGCDVWLRLHCNSYSSASVNGIEVHVSKSYAQPEVSYAIGEAVLNRMVAATGARNRGMWVGDNYSGNNWSEGPCLLIEMGYASNYTEDRNLNSPEYQLILSESMTAGLIEYFEGQSVPTESGSKEE